MVAKVFAPVEGVNGELAVPPATELPFARRGQSSRVSMEFPLEVDVTTAAQQVQAGALLLDIREPFETAICTVAGSRLMPMREVPEHLADLPRDQPILVLCHAGVRSLRVTQFLRANGFAQVSNVAGGITAWSEQIDPSLARY